MGIKCIDAVLNRYFYKLGLAVGKHPGYFLIIPIFLTLFFVTGYQRIKYNIDPEYLFSPTNGDGKIERAIVESYFKVNYTNRFDVARITRAGTSLLLYIISLLLKKRRNTDNLLINVIKSKEIIVIKTLFVIKIITRRFHFWLKDVEILIM